MKKKLTWIIISVFLVALIGGASVLYNQLGAEYQMDHLATQPPVATEAPETPTEAEPVPEVTEQPEETTEPAEPESSLAPDFTALDAEGNEVKLSDYFGKPIVLNFWASWCGPCKAEMPDFDAAYQELGDKVQFLMVNLTDGNAETVESAAACIAQAGYTFPVFYDTASEAAMAYGVQSIPTTFFIDAQGAAVAYYTGTMPKELLDKGISMILPE